MGMGTARAGDLVIPTFDEGMLKTEMNMPSPLWIEENVFPNNLPRNPSSDVSDPSLTYKAPPNTEPPVTGPFDFKPLPVSDEGGEHSPVICSSNAGWLLWFGGKKAVGDCVEGTPAPQPDTPPSSTSAGDLPNNGPSHGGGIADEPPISDPPASAPEPGTLGLLIAGAAFGAIRSLRLKRS